MAAIEIETTFDETGLQQGLNKTKKALSDFQKEVENTGNKPLFDKISNDPAIARIQVNMVKLADKIRDTNEELREQEAALRILEKGYNRAVEAQDEDAIKRYNKELEKQRDIITDLQAKNAGYAANLGNMYRQLENAQGGFNKMGGAARVLRTITAGLPQELRGVTTAITGVGTAAAQGARAFGVWGAAIAVAAKLASVALAELKKGQEDAKKTAEDWRQEAASSAAVQIAAFQKLRQEYSSLADSEEARSKWIKQNKSNIDELGTSVNNTAEAEDLFINHADDFVKSLEARAKATAYMKVATDQYASYMDKLLKAEQLRDFRKTTGPNFMDFAKGFFQTEAPLGSPLFVPSLIKAAGVNQSERENKEADELVGEAERVWTKAQQSLEKYFKNNNLASLIFNTGGSGDGDNTTTAALDLAKNIKAARRKAVEASIEGTLEGYDKDSMLALARFNFEKEDIEARKEANLALAKTEKEKADVIALYNAEIAAAELRYQNTMDSLRDRELKQTENDNQKTINEWKKYGEELVRIETERQQKLKNVSENTGLSEEERQRQIEDINNWANYGLKEAASQLGVDVSDIQGALLEELNNTLDLSVTEILNKVEEIKPEIESLDLSGNLTKEQVQLVAKYYAQLSLLAKKWGEVGKETNKTGQKEKSTLKETAELLSSTKDLVKELGEAFGDSLSEGAKAALTAAENVATGTIAMIGSIEKLTNAAAASMSAMEKASVILTAISAAVKIVSGIIKYVTENSELAQQTRVAEKAVERQQRLVDAIQKLNDIKGAKITNETLGGGADYWKAQYERLQRQGSGRAAAASEYDREIAAQEALWKKAQKAYELAQQARIKYTNTGQQVLSNDEKLVEAEEKAYERLLDAQQDYYNSLINKTEAIKDIWDEYLAATPESLASNIADSIVDGFANGLDESEKIWDESIDNMMRTALKQQLARQLTDVFEQTFSRISAGGYLDDGEISASEAAEIRRELDKAKESGQQYIDLAKQIADTLGLDEEANVTADTGALAQASQDSIDLLTGIATSIQGFCLNIDNSLRSVAQNNADGLVVLRAIQSDTARLEAIEYSIHEIRETFADVNTRGIKVNMG